METMSKDRKMVSVRKRCILITTIPFRTALVLWMGHFWPFSQNKRVLFENSLYPLHLCTLISCDAYCVDDVLTGNFSVYLTLFIHLHHLWEVEESSLYLNNDFIKGKGRVHAIPSWVWWLLGGWSTVTRWLFRKRNGFFSFLVYWDSMGIKTYLFID